MTLGPYKEICDRRFSSLVMKFFSQYVFGSGQYNDSSLPNKIKSGIKICSKFKFECVGGNEIRSHHHWNHNAACRLSVPGSCSKNGLLLTTWWLHWKCISRVVKVNLYFKIEKWYICKVIIDINAMLQYFKAKFWIQEIIKALIPEWSKREGGS